MPPSGVGVWGALTVVVHAQLIIPHASHYMANDTTRWKPRPDITVFRTGINSGTFMDVGAANQHFPTFVRGCRERISHAPENFDIVSRLGSLLS